MDYFDNLKEKIKEFVKRQNELKIENEDLQKIKNLVEKLKKGFENEISNDTNPFRKKQRETIKLEVETKEKEFKEKEKDIIKKEEQLYNDYNDFIVNNKEEIQTEKKDMLDTMEKLKKEKEKLVSQKNVYQRRLQEWEENNINQEDVLYVRLKTKLIPDVDLQIVQIDKEEEQKTIEFSDKWDKLETIDEILNNLHTMQYKLQELNEKLNEFELSQKIEEREDYLKLDSEEKDDKTKIEVVESSTEKQEEDLSDDEEQELKEEDFLDDEEQDFDEPTKRITDIDKVYNIPEHKRKINNLIKDINMMMNYGIMNGDYSFLKKQLEYIDRIGFNKWVNDNLGKLIKDVSNDDIFQLEQLIKRGKELIQIIDEKENITSTKENLKNEKEEKSSIQIGRTGKITIKGETHKISASKIAGAQKLSNKEISKILMDYGLEYDEKLKNNQYFDKTVIAIIDSTKIYYRKADRAKLIIDYIDSISKAKKNSIYTERGRKSWEKEIKENPISFKLVYNLEELSKISFKDIFSKKELKGKDKLKLSNIANLTNRLGISEVKGEYKPSFLSRLFSGELFNRNARFPTREEQLHAAKAYDYLQDNRKKFKNNMKFKNLDNYNSQERKAQSYSKLRGLEKREVRALEKYGNIQKFEQREEQKYTPIEDKEH